MSLNLTKNYLFLQYLKYTILKYTLWWILWHLFCILNVHILVYIWSKFKRFDYRKSYTNYILILHRGWLWHWKLPLEFELHGAFLFKIWEHILFFLKKNLKLVAIGRGNDVLCQHKESQFKISYTGEQTFTRVQISGLTYVCFIKTEYSFSGRRCSRRQRDVCDDSVNFKI
jgi:hypothetical protein